MVTKFNGVLFSVMLSLSSFSLSFSAGVVGEAAAGFTLEDLEGGTHTLADYQAKKVVLLFMLGYS